MKRLPIPTGFQRSADALGITVRHFINDYAIRGGYLSRHEKKELLLSKEERDYLINILMGRQE